MTKVQTSAVIALILVLLSSSYYLDDAISWAAGTEESANYKDVEFDALNEKDLDIIDAVKQQMEFAE